MVRVWGGGIYESNIFYDLCDKYGLLVFQDFMFACGSYPAHPSFLASVKTEAEDNVKRLRNHPSITFWAGNNEDYPLAESMGINYDGNDEVDFEKFPGRKIYERVLKDVTSALCKDIPYAFGSPYGGVNSGDQTIGDIHQWNVWHGSQNPYQQYGILSGRFVSEFGMQGHPHIRTVKCFFPEDADAAQKRPDYHPQSYFVDHHNKASGGDRRLAIYVFENIKLSSMKLEDYVYASQLMQSEAIYWAIRDWRREWKGAEKAYCGGVLVWQINDCWPVTSWATVDFYVRPKPAFFAEKRALARTTVNLCRRRISEKFTAGESPADAKINTTVYTASEATPHKCSVWVSSFDKFKGGKVVVRAFTLAGNLKKEWIGDIGVIDNASVDVMDVDVPVDEETVIGAWLVSKGESVSVVENVGDAIARAVDFPQPLRYVDFVHPKITASSGSKTAGDGWEILDITASTPVKHMIFDAASGEDLEWDDNAVDLVPGEVLKVKVKGRNGGGVVGQWLGGYEVQTEVFQI
ncbi:hypothetical protein HK098_005663 [Nowakowskiella sp. JEL0407]|nr:hypothetical protein HK098_005663 [Nowakowskiella sp. JEL0407]